jgi:hypothetical protein
MAFKKGNIAWNKGLKGYKGGLKSFSKGHIPWNKGLTKDTDDRQLYASLKMHEAHLLKRQLKGDDSGVGGKHDRLRREFGKERICENCHTANAKLYDWANLDHKYNSDDKEAWMRLCRKCHAKYDFGKIPLKGLFITDRGAIDKSKILKNLIMAKCGDENISKRPDIRAKISASLTGRKASDETRLKQSLSHLGKSNKRVSN